MVVTCDICRYYNGLDIVFKVFSSLLSCKYTFIYAGSQGKKIEYNFLFHNFASQSEEPTVPNVSSCVSPQNTFESNAKGLNPKFLTRKLRMRNRNVDLPHVKVEPILPTSRC